MLECDLMCMQGCAGYRQKLCMRQQVGAVQRLKFNRQREWARKIERVIHQPESSGSTMRADLMRIATYWGSGQQSKIAGESLQHGECSTGWLAMLHIDNRA